MLLRCLRAVATISGRTSPEEEGACGVALRTVQTSFWYYIFSGCWPTNSKYAPPRPEIGGPRSVMMMIGIITGTSDVFYPTSDMTFIIHDVLGVCSLGVVESY